MSRPHPQTKLGNRRVDPRCLYGVLKTRQSFYAAWAKKASGAMEITLLMAIPTKTDGLALDFQDGILPLALLKAAAFEFHCFVPVNVVTCKQKSGGRRYATENWISRNA